MIIIGILLYYIDNCKNIYSLFSVFTLGIGHIITPFLLTPSLFIYIKKLSSITI